MKKITFLLAFIAAFFLGGYKVTAQNICDLSLVIGSDLICHQDNSYTVSVQALYTSPPSGGSLVIEGTSFPITGSGQTHYVTLPGDGSTQNIDAYFSANPGCSATSVDITGPTCSGTGTAENCYINVVIASDLGCDPVTGMIDVMVSVYYDSVPPGAQLVIEGTPYTPSGSPQTVMVQVLGNGSTYVFDALFTNVQGCAQASTSLMVPNCAPCNLDCEGICNGTSLPGVACNDGNPNTINDMYTSNCVCAGTVAMIDCTGILNGPNMPGTNCNDGNVNTIDDTWSANCVCSGTAVSQPLSIISGSISTSVSGGFYTVTFQVTGGNGVYNGNNGTFAGSYFTSAMIPCGQNISFTINDTAGADPVSTSVTSPCSSDPCGDLVIAQSAYDCQQTGGQWSLTLTVSGGSAPYVIVGNFSNEEFAGGAFTFNGDDGSNVNINITDANGCTESYSASNVLCIKCQYSIETVGLAQSVCGNQSVSATHVLSNDLNQFPDNGVIIYAVHTNPNPVAGNILATNTTGVFNFSQLSGAQYGVTYYISAVAGPDDDGDGLPDLTDPCTKVAAGVPVTFNTGGTLSVDLTDICNHDTGETTVLLTVSGGSPSPYYNISGNVSGQYLPSQFPLSFLVGDGQMVSINATDGSFCSSQGAATAGPFTCEKTPIELLSLNGKALVNGNLISWTTGSEIENDHFSIGRSNDGINYTEIAQIKGSGTTTSATDYDYLDQKSPAGISYYRLTQTDMDGNTTVAGIVDIDRITNHLGQLHISPIPASEEISISFDLSEAQIVDIRIVDLAGKIIKQISQSAHSGTNNLIISINALSNGIYQLQVGDGNNKISSKFIKT